MAPNQCRADHSFVGARELNRIDRMSELWCVGHDEELTALNAQLHHSFSEICQSAIGKNEIKRQWTEIEIDAGGHIREHCTVPIIELWIQSIEPLPLNWSSLTYWNLEDWRWPRRLTSPKGS